MREARNGRKDTAEHYTIKSGREKPSLQPITPASLPHVSCPRPRRLRAAASGPPIGVTRWQRRTPRLLAASGVPRPKRTRNRPSPSEPALEWSLRGPDRAKRREGACDGGLAADDRVLRHDGPRGRPAQGRASSPRDNQRELSSLVMNVACPALVNIRRRERDRAHPSARPRLLLRRVRSHARVHGAHRIASTPPAALPESRARCGEPHVRGDQRIVHRPAPHFERLRPRRGLLLVLFLIPAGFFLYSYAIAVISKRADGAPAPQQGFARKAAGVRAPTGEPGMAACVIALALYLGGVELPYVLAEPVSMVGDLSAPLAMILIGASFADIKPRELFCDVRLNLFILLKMLIIPHRRHAGAQACHRKRIPAHHLHGEPLGAYGEHGRHAGFAVQQRPLPAHHASGGPHTLVSVATMPIVSLVCGIG